MRRPTVLFINRVFPPVHGATGRVLKDLGQAFARKGWHVTVVSSGPVAGESRIDGVRIMRVKGPEKPAGAFSYFWVWLKMLFLALRLKKRHLVVTMSDPPMIVVAGSIISAFKGSKHIHWSHDLYPELLPVVGMKMSQSKLNWLKRMRNRALKKCDRIVVVGRCMAKYMSDNGVDARKVSMIPNWPDIELTDPEMIEQTGKSYGALDPEISRPFDKQKKGMERFRILYAGNMGKAHTGTIILDAAEILQEEDPDIEIVFVGSSSAYDELAQDRARRRLDNVRFLPYQPVERLRETLESGYVHLITMKDGAARFLVPSKLYAALAVARPSIFIGPVNTEVAKVLNDFGAGEVIANGDAQGLAKAMMAYKDDQKLWQKAQSGAVEARDVFTPKDSLEAWIARAMAIVEEDLTK